MREILFILIILIFHQPGRSQEAISISYNYGQILVHSPKIEPLVNGPVRGFTICYAFSGKKGAEWRQL